VEGPIQKIDIDFNTTRAGCSSETTLAQIDYLTTYVTTVHKINIEKHKCNYGLKFTGWENLEHLEQGRT